MPFIMLGFFAVLLVSAAVQYMVCRVTKKWFYRVLPLTVTLMVTAGVGTSRYFGWSAEHGGENAPLETLLLIPGAPALLVLVGLLLGWRFWRRRWLPRVVNEKKR